MVGAAHLTSYFGGTAATRAWVVAGAAAGAALLVSTCLALFLGEVESAKRLEGAIAQVIREGKQVTYDMKADRNDKSAVGTREMGRAVIKALDAVAV